MTCYEMLALYDMSDSNDILWRAGFEWRDNSPVHVKEEQPVNDGHEPLWEKLSKNEGNIQFLLFQGAPLIRFVRHWSIAMFHYDTMRFG